MSNASFIKIEQSFTEKEDECFSEEEDNSLSARLTSMEKSRTLLYLNSPKNCEPQRSALDFDSLIKKSPFLEDFKLRKSPDRNPSEISLGISPDQINFKSAYFNIAAQQLSECSEPQHRTPYSADITFDDSPKFADLGIRTASEAHARSSSYDANQNGLYKGILKTGIRSRFYKDLNQNDGVPKLAKSKKSSSFKIPKGEKLKVSSRTHSPLKYSKTTLKR